MRERRNEFGLSSRPVTVPDDPGIAPRRAEPKIQVFGVAVLLVATVAGRLAVAYEPNCSMRSRTSSIRESPGDSSASRIRSACSSAARSPAASPRSLRHEA